MFYTVVQNIFVEIVINGYNKARQEYKDEKKAKKAYKIVNYKYPVVNIATYSLQEFARLRGVAR